MNIFEKLRGGESVDMMSEEYRPAIAELLRADKALFHLNLYFRRRARQKRNRQKHPQR